MAHICDWDDACMYKSRDECPHASTECCSRPEHYGIFEKATDVFKRLEELKK
jgi:hypothetical protein